MGDVLSNYAQDIQSAQTRTTYAGDGSSTPLGRVISVNGSKVRGVLYDAVGPSGAPVQATSLRIGTILKITTPASAASSAGAEASAGR